MRQFNLLVADQDVGHLQKMFQYLDREAHYNILSATDATVMLRIIQHKPVDLMLIDWQILNQVESTIQQKLQEDQPSKATSLLIMSALSPAKHPPLPENLRNHVWIFKPVQEQELLQKVQTCLHEKQPPAQKLSPPASTREDYPNLPEEIIRQASAEMLPHLDAIFERYKQTLDFEREKLEAERQSLHFLREQLNHEREKLNTEKNKLETEKRDLEKQQKRFTLEENQLFAAQVKLQKSNQDLDHEKKVLQQARKELAQAREKLKKDRYTLELAKKDQDQPPSRDDQPA